MCFQQAIFKVFCKPPFKGGLFFKKKINYVFSLLLQENIFIKANTSLIILLSILTIY